jgi:hypothetical protein
MRTSTIIPWLSVQWAIARHCGKTSVVELGESTGGWAWRTDIPRAVRVASTSGMPLSDAIWAAFVWNSFPKTIYR